MPVIEMSPRCTRGVSGLCEARWRRGALPPPLADEDPRRSMPGGERDRLAYGGCERPWPGAVGRPLGILDPEEERREGGALLRPSLRKRSSPASAGEC